jgi:hypothetical protein
MHKFNPYKNESISKFSIFFKTNLKNSIKAVKKILSYYNEWVAPDVYKFH